MKVSDKCGGVLKKLSQCRAVLRPLLLAFSIGVLVGPIASELTFANERPLRIGATYISYPSETVRHFEVTVEAIGRTLNRDVSFQLYDVRELEALVREGKVDLVFTGAGFYRRMETYGLRVLATEVSPRMPDPDRTTGTTFIVRKDRADLRTIADLKGKRLAALAPESFQGYQIGMGEIFAEPGFSPKEKFFGETYFVGAANGSDMPKVVEAVLDGKADVGFVHACFLEDLAAAGDKSVEALRVVNEKRSEADGMLGCRVSTARYPSWSVSSLPSMDHESLRTVARLLLDMPATSAGYRWSIAADFRPVDALFKKLHVGPYAYLDQWTLERFWTEYRVLITVFIVGLIALVAHAYRADVLVKRRTRELSAAFEAQAKLMEEKRAAEEAAERLQRAFLVGRLSTLFAHELKQPLLSLTCYAHGLLRLLDRGSGEEGRNNEEALRTGLEAVRRQAVHCADIVERVRGYAKRRNAHLETVDLRSLLDEILSDLRKGSTAETEAALPQSPIYVRADPGDLRLALLNVLRNAEQAARSTPEEKPRVRVALSVVRSTDERAKENEAVTESLDVEQTGGRCPCALIVIEDNGAAVPDEVFAHMCDPLFSTKAEGLGLGLVIVGEILERLGGSFRIQRKCDFVREADPSRPPTPGVRVKITLPVVQKEEKDAA